MCIRCACGLEASHFGGMGTKIVGHANWGRIEFELEENGQ